MNIEEKDLVFTGRNISIKELASAMNKSPQYVRLAIREGVLDAGIALKRDGCTQFSYYCSDRKVYESIGYYNPDAYK